MFQILLFYKLYWLMQESRRSLWQMTNISTSTFVRFRPLLGSSCTLYICWNFQKMRTLAVHSVTSSLCRPVNWRLTAAATYTKNASLPTRTRVGNTGSLPEIWRARSSPFVAGKEISELRPLFSSLVNWSGVYIVWINLFL